MERRSNTFRLSRYFSMASLATVVAAPLVLGWIYRHIAVADLQQQGERHNGALMQAFFNVLAPQIRDLVATADGAHDDAHRLALQTFTGSIKSVTAGTPVARIRIFDRGGRIVYSNDASEIGRQAEFDYPGGAAAASGAIVTVLFRQSVAAMADRRLLATYLPVRGTAGDAIAGVFEIDSDVTEPYQGILTSRNRFVLAVALIMGGIYLVLFFLVRNADQIIRRQGREQERHMDEVERINKDLDRYAGDLARARDEAIEASAAKSRFLANMSHELRTPLNAIIGYSEMLLEERDEEREPELVGDLRKIEGAGKHLLRIINDVLDLSKIEARRMELIVESFAISDVVADIAATLKPLADKTRNDLTVDCPRDIGEMHSDMTRVRQILFNVVGNACKFTDHGRVALAARRRRAQGRDWVVFTIKDTGIGMTEEQIRTKIFRPFQQADAAATRHRGGTGLGLTISKQFCEALGGDIAVRSTPGRGSIFTVTLPVVATAPPAEGHGPLFDKSAANG